MSATLSLPPRQTHNLQPLFPVLSAVEAESGDDISDIKNWCLARADEWYARRELGAARDFLNHAASVDPKDVQVWLTLGSVQYELGALEQAGLAFHMAGELAPSDARVFLHLGLVHQQLQQNEEAEAMFRHSLALAPHYTLAMNLLGLFLMAADRHAEARPFFADALAHQPDDIETLLRLGVCCFKAQNFDVARTCYERVLHLSPGHELATENLEALKGFSTEAA